MCVVISLNIKDIFEYLTVFFIYLFIFIFAEEHVQKIFDLGSIVDL